MVDTAALSQNCDLVLTLKFYDNGGICLKAFLGQKHPDITHGQRARDLSEQGLERRTRIHEGRWQLAQVAQDLS